MPTKRRSGADTFHDPNDAPILTREWFEGAEFRRAGRLLKRGRPKLDNPRQQISVRLSPHVIEHFKAMGPGWQTKLNAALEKVVGRQRKKAG